MKQIFDGGPLSGSTDGKPIAVVATGSPGTLVHTAGAGASDFDELWIYASNVTASDATLTIQWGGTSGDGDLLCKGYTIPANENGVPIAVGQRIRNGLAVRAYSSNANAINLTGLYNRAQE